VSGWDDLVLVGRIARTHGNRGQVIVNPETDFPEQRFAAGAVLHTRRDGAEGTVRITASRMHQGRPIVSIEGIDTMTDAEGLAGLELRVPESSLAPLPPGTFYHHQLVGCEVSTTAGRVLGPVRKVEGGAGTARLVIGEGRGEVQIPLVDALCVAIDVGARRIVVDPPEGLLDLNA
jgi:16S rRNA processing protein RimM